MVHESRSNILNSIVQNGAVSKQNMFLQRPVFVSNEVVGKSGTALGKDLSKTDGATRNNMEKKENRTGIHFTFMV